MSELDWLDDDFEIATDIDVGCKEHDKLTKQDKEAVQDLMAFKERYKNGE